MSGVEKRAYIQSKVKSAHYLFSIQSPSFAHPCPFLRTVAREKVAGKEWEREKSGRFPPPPSVPLLNGKDEGEIRKGEGIILTEIQSITSRSRENYIGFFKINFSKIKSYIFKKNYFNFKKINWVIYYMWFLQNHFYSKISIV